MITRFRVKGYKILKDMEIPLSRLTVLVGPNGSGKSSVLEALEGSLRALVGKDNDVELRKQASRPDLGEMLFSPSFGTAGTYSLAGQPGARLHTDGPNVQQTVETSSWPVVRLRFSHQSLVAATPGAMDVPTLSLEGNGLATLVSHLASRRDGSLERIEEGVRRVVPAFRKLGTVPTTVSEWMTDSQGGDVRNQKLRPLPGHRLLVTMAGVGEIPIAQVSEGTTFAIGLLSFLHCQAARTILLDDVDRGLHPKAQLELVHLLRAITELPEGPQIIATAHSPMLLAGLREGEIVRLDLDDERGCVVIQEPSGPPGWMTINEILDHFFGIQRPALGADLQRYALLAGNTRRNVAEEAEVQELRRSLLGAGLDPGMEPVLRAEP